MLKPRQMLKPRLERPLRRQLTQRQPPMPRLM